MALTYNRPRLQPLRGWERQPLRSIRLRHLGATQLDGLRSGSVRLLRSATAVLKNCGSLHAIVRAAIAISLTSRQSVCDGARPHDLPVVLVFSFRPLHFHFIVRFLSRVTTSSQDDIFNCALFCTLRKAYLLVRDASDLTLAATCESFGHVMAYRTALVPERYDRRHHAGMLLR